VARSTVYLIFGSRAGLFDAVIGDLAQRAGFDRVTTAVALPDAREHLRQGIRAGAEVYAVDRDVHRILFSMATIDPDVAAGAMQRMEERRFGGMTYLAGRLAEQGVLRPDLSAADAAHILFVLTSFDAFDLLYASRGRPVGEVGDLLATMAERAVCR
jgi:AcrR family transcriptional regulator